MLDIHHTQTRTMDSPSPDPGSDLPEDLLSHLRLLPQLRADLQALKALDDVPKRGDFGPKIPPPPKKNARWARK